MAKPTDALHSAISHWQRDAANGAKDATALRTSMRALAANIDTSPPSHVSGPEKLRMHGKLERMAHAVGEARRRPYGQAFDQPPSISTIA